MARRRFSRRSRTEYVHPGIEITSLTDTRGSDYTHVGRPDWLRERGVFRAQGPLVGRRRLWRGGRLVVRRLFQTPSFGVRPVLLTSTAFGALEGVLDRTRCPIY